jgi:flagella basal body P-ring formation protein FlgA
MRFFTSTVTVLLMLACTQAQAERLALKAAATVDGARISLADVAVGGEDESALRAVDLGASPLPGYTARISHAEIARMLRARALPFELASGGVAAVMVERRVQAFDQREIGAAAQRYVQQLLAGQATRVELQLSEALPDMQLPAGPVRLQARPLGAEAALHPRVTVWVDVEVGGAFVRSVAVPLTVRAYRAVLVARHDLAAGIAPRCDSLELREQDVAALDSAPVGADCAAVQGRLKRALSSGAALQKNALQADLAVSQGESVSLQMVDGSIVLESRATAMADASVGQSVDVKPSGSTQAVRAEVIGPGLVKITGK